MSRHSLLKSVAIAACATLTACDAQRIDVSDRASYANMLGQTCEVNLSLQATGWSKDIGRERKTAEVSIWNPGFAGPEVTFVVMLQAGTYLTLLRARECVNCPFDRSPEYLVKVSPEPSEFSGVPAYMRAKEALIK